MKLAVGMQAGALTNQLHAFSWRVTNFLHGSQNKLAQNLSRQSCYQCKPSCCSGGAPRFNPLAIMQTRSQACADVWCHVQASWSPS